MTKVTERLGEVEREAGDVRLRYDRRLAHSPERVWQAITESEHLAHWFPADIVGDRVAGAELRFPFWQRSLDHAAEELEQAGVDLADPVLGGELIAWEPHRVFEFRWDTEQLRFELEPDGAGTRLVLTVRVQLGAEGPRGLEGTAAGYHVCLDLLRATLGGAQASLPEGDVLVALEERYAALDNG